MVTKIYGCIIVSVLLLGLCFYGHFQRAEASNGLIYKSDRIQIVRPEKTDAPSAEAVLSETLSDAEKIAPPEAAPPEPDVAVSDVTPIDPASRTKEPAVETASPPATDFSEAATEETIEETAEEMTEEMIREEISNIIGKKEEFYTRKGRIDPFEPFLRQPEPDVVSEEQARIERRVPRTPLEKIDMSQLRLTSILRMPEKTRALVQESSGKGYVVSEGTYIGNKGGQLSKILKDRIVVEEKYLDVFGKVSVRERELKLQQ